MKRKFECKKINWNSYAIIFETGDGDENSGCKLLIQFGFWWIVIPLPQLMSPEKDWVDTSKYAWSNNPAGGYYERWSRDYGVRWNDGMFRIYYGKQTHDSRTDKNKGFFIPWLQWNHVRHSVFDIDGKSRLDVPTISWKLGGNTPYRMIESLPRKEFLFKDFDGEEIKALCLIEEREWHRGEGYFKWLKYFYQPKVSRSLEIKFSSEVGSRKGSWKGGTIGHSIEMADNKEPIDQAFKRYCIANKLEFIN